MRQQSSIPAPHPTPLRWKRGLGRALDNRSAAPVASSGSHSPRWRNSAPGHRTLAKIWARFLPREASAGPTRRAHQVVIAGAAAIGQTPLPATPSLVEVSHQAPRVGVRRHPWPASRRVAGLIVKHPTAGPGFLRKFITQPSRMNHFDALQWPGACRSCGGCCGCRWRGLRRGRW